MPWAGFYDLCKVVAERFRYQQHCTRIHESQGLDSVPLQYTCDAWFESKKVHRNPFSFHPKIHYFSLPMPTRGASKSSTTDAAWKKLSPKIQPFRPFIPNILIWHSVPSLAMVRACLLMLTSLPAMWMLTRGGLLHWNVPRYSPRSDFVTLT